MFNIRTMSSIALKKAQKHITVYATKTIDKKRMKIKIMKKLEMRLKKIYTGQIMIIVEERFVKRRIKKIR